MRLLIVVGLLPLFSTSPLFPAPINTQTGLYSNKDLGLQARTEANRLISTLRELAQDPTSPASQTIRNVFNRDNICLNNIEEAVQVIQDGSSLVEATEGDLRSLGSRLESLIELTDEEEVVREVASIFRSVEPLITKISPARSSSNICSDSPEAYISSLSVLLQELSENSQLQPLDRGTLAESAPILDTVTTFLSELSTKTKNFENVCSTGEEASDRGVRVMGEILDSLADLAERLGNNRVAEEISKRKGIPDQIFRQLTEKDIGLELGLDCSATDLSGTAATLEDIANVIRDIGFDTLKSELGVDIDLSLLG